MSTLPRFRHPWRRFVELRLPFGLVLSIFGVGSGGACIPATQPQDGNVGASGSTSSSGLRLTGEPNDSFDAALDVVFDDAGNGQLQGTISTSTDVDVYRLGPFTAGDRIIVDMQTTGGTSLDGDAALFDEGGRLVYENDDRNYDLGQYDPFINHVIRHDSLVYYLAVASAPLNPTTGTYEVLLTVARGGEVPATAGQVVALDFDGGSIVIDGDTYTVDPFDTAEIGSEYTGMTDTVRERVAEVVAENYDGLDLDIRVIPGDTLPEDGHYSTLLFGGQSSTAYGLAQQVDPYNSDNSDSAIIFVETFRSFRFGGQLSAKELGTAIGNVASHELGHLLGLNHVANITDLMDTTGTASTFLLDQEFVSSPLDETIFPIGVQDSWLLLLETLGLSDSSAQ